MGQIPSVAEARERLQYLKENGPTPHAFTFRSPFPAPGAQEDAIDPLDASFCEWATND